MKYLQLITLFLVLYFKVGAVAFSQTNNVLLEYCSGTWNQWDPCGSEVIASIKQSYPNTIVLAYHGAGSDPWQSYSSGIRSLFGFNAYPTGCICRMTGIISRSAWANQVAIQSSFQPGVLFEIANKAYFPSTRAFHLNLKIRANTDLVGSFYINFVLVEDSLIYNQTGNSSCIGGPNYIHLNVVKGMINGDTGEELISGSWNQSTIIEKSLVYQIPSAPQIQDVEKCSIVAFVYLQGSSISTNNFVQQSIKTPITDSIARPHNLLFEENFDYQGWDSLGAHGWTSFSGGSTNVLTVTPPSLLFEGYPGSGVGNSILLNTSGQDAFSPILEPCVSDSIYLAATVKVESAQSGDYFLAFLPSTSTTFYSGRIHARINGSHLNFGITKGAATDTTVQGIWTTDNYSVNSTYVLILKYKFVDGETNDKVSLYVFPSLISMFEPTPTIGPLAFPSGDAPDIGKVALRQGTSSRAPQVRVDGIRVGRSWRMLFDSTFQCPITWGHIIKIADAGINHDSLKLGMSPFGTTDLDTCLGEVLVPPPPPSGVFDCRFVLPNNDAVKTDIRKDTIQNINWRMVFQPSVSGYPITFSWSPSTLPIIGSFFLKDEITGTIVNVNMRTQASYTLTNAGISSLKIEYMYNQIQTTSVSSGWNIVSVPLRTQDMLYSALFPSVASPAYTYSNGYVSIAMLSNGTGYWMKFNNAANFNFTGYPWTPENMLVSPGWNLIGPFDNNIPISSIMSNPAGIVTSNYFGYNGGYYNPDTLKVGRGYWIRTSTAGYLYQGSADNNPNAIATNPLEDFVEVRFINGDDNSTALYLGNASELTSDYSMPPVPPSGIFDVRFATDKFVEELGKIHTLKLNSATGQTRITLHNARGLKMKIKDAIDGTIINKEIEEGNEIIIPANLENLVLETNGIIPKTYELSQNYPNPFNPVTTIKYQIPDDGLVKLIVFDVLGREVKTLVNTVQKAGVYEVRFDASDVASGVYFYRMTSGKFEDLKKLVVIK